MAKTMLNIKGELFDMWEVRTITRFEEYNDLKEDVDYYIQLNREGAATNANNILILFDSYEEREDELEKIRVKLNDMDVIAII